MTINKKKVEEVQTSKKASFMKRAKKVAVNIVIILILSISLFVASMHPQVREYYEKYFPSEENLEIERLNDEILLIKTMINSDLQKDLEILSLNSNVLQLEKKFDILGENNLNIIRSKADVGLVLGIIGRLDNIENKVLEVAKVSDKGALIATATMLVKDAASRGGEFVYEFSVLEQLAKDEARIKGYLDIVGSSSKEGVYGELFLVNEFEKIYKLSSVVENDITEGDDWRAKFNKKFGKIITIKYKKANIDAAEEEEYNLDKAMYLINTGEINRAVEELSKNEYVNMLSENEALKSWLYYAKNRVEFFDAISKISAYSLGIMKANEFR